VYFNDREVTNMSVEDRQTAMVFQNYALWPHMTVRQNVEFGPKMRGVTRQKRAELAKQSLEQVQMEGYERRRPGQLSGGQQQRIALARALAARPACLLLDEPLSNLDARLRLHMRGELRRLVKDHAATGVYVTHDQKEALSMADRVAVMDAGRIVQVGTPEELYHRPATHFVADFLGEANFVAGTMNAVRDAVETSLGAIPLSGRSELPAGAAVTCCVRPERVRLNCDAAGGGQGSLPAEVVSATFLGEIRQYVCRMGDGSRWKATALSDASAPAKSGQKVLLEFSPADVAVLPGGTPAKG
jgi:iron(III) transport system ATP-binding protein